MDDQKKPSARRKKIVGEGRGIEKKGEGLGTGPVGQQGGQKPAVQQPAKPAVQSAPKTTQSTQRPQQGGFFGQSSSGTQRPQESASSGQGTPRPAQNAQQTQQSFFGQKPQSAQRPAQNPFGQSQQSTQRPTQSAAQSQQRPQSSARPQQQQQQASRPAAAGGNNVQRASGSGGGSKLILIIVALVVLLGGGKLSGLFGGNSSDSSQSLVSSLTGTSQTQTGDNGGGSIMNLLSSFMGGTTNNSAYDFSGILSGLTGGGTTGAASTASTNSYQQYFTTSMDNNTTEADTTVASGAREKFTVIKGGNQDTMTIMVYMCGADLESQNGMATSDLKEMLNAKLSDNVNLIVFTGGARRWQNNVVDSKVNQIYQIKNGSLTRLVSDGGNASMTNPGTLASFIKFGKENFPANRMCLIFWDHGGGSISGYGYDERYGSGQTMTLAGINEALKNGGVKFDFIGFDTCLLATLENGLMLSQYADYMIASEETEPGVGWYYTNWLSKVSSNTSMNTVQIGKTIVDDFVEVCDRQCRGQATTLSVTDLAELAATVPTELKDFSVETNELIQNKEYKKVSSARGKTREFASSTKIDQIDLVHFAKNMGTAEGKQLADALQGAVKYNRTGGGISNAYGLSIYFPYKKTGKVSQIVSTYKAIGMSDEYTRCIQEFASLEVSGQLSSGSSVESYGSSNAMAGLMESLMGGGNTYSSIGNTYSSGGLEDLLGGFYGGGSGSGSTGSILDLLIGRSMNAEKAAAYIQENHFDPSNLQWNNDRITLSDEQWANLISVERNMFYDDGKGYIDMGFDPFVERDGNDLVYEFDGTWFSIDQQEVPYYRIAEIEQGEWNTEIGYVPAIVNDIRANLILVFDNEHPDGNIAGAEPVYTNGETDTQAKNLIGIGKGDKIQFVCDYYDYQGNYQDSYKLGDPIVLGDEVLIGYVYVKNADQCRLTYCLTDYYQQKYWTPVK